MRHSFFAVLMLALSFLACKFNQSAERLLGLSSDELRKKEDLKMPDFPAYTSVDPTTGHKTIKVTIVTRTFYNGIADLKGESYVPRYGNEELAQHELGSVTMKELRGWLLGSDGKQPFLTGAKEQTVESGTWTTDWYTYAPQEPASTSQADEPTAGASAGTTQQPTTVQIPKLVKYTVTYPYAHYKITAQGSRAIGGSKEPLDWDVDIYVNDAYLWKKAGELSKRLEESNVIIFNGLGSEAFSYQYLMFQPNGANATPAQGRKLVVANRCQTEGEEQLIASYFINDPGKIDLVSNRTYTYIKWFAFTNERFFANLARGVAWPELVDSFAVHNSWDKRPDTKPVLLEIDPAKMRADQQRLQAELEQRRKEREAAAAQSSSAGSATSPLPVSLPTTPGQEATSQTTNANANP